MWIPESLRKIKQWVVWKTIERGGKPTKAPFQPGGEPASSTDPATWECFECVEKVRGRFSGLGFVFSESDPFCGIDLDGCRNHETKEVATWAKDIILQLDSYSEVSPSLTGVKVFVRAKSPMPTGKKRELPDMPVMCTGKTPAIEIYDHARYFAVTGMRLKGTGEINERQEVVNSLCKRFFDDKETQRQEQRQSRLSVIERARKYLDMIPGAISGQGGHNEAFKAACVLVLGFSLTPTEALILLSEWNNRCEPPWSEKELRHKVESADKQGGERGYLRDAREEDLATVKVPDYKQPAQVRKEATSPVKITTRHDAAIKYVDTLSAGKADLVTTGITEVDYAIGGGMEFGEMVIVAARPSHGKTAFALQSLDHIAAAKIPCAIVSEEMSALALGKRSIQYLTGAPEEHWPLHVAEVRGEIDQHFGVQATCYILEGCGRADVAAEQVRRLVREKGVRCVGIDYAQLLASKGGSRYEQITQTSIVLRQVANELGVLLLVLCQLSRTIEGRTKFIPQMSDLKDSGQLEQDADVILFLVWPHRIDSKKFAAEDYQVWVAKNRNRPINQNMVECQFSPSRQKITESRIFVPETGGHRSEAFNFGEYGEF